jgi:hypothetical protein
MMLSHSKCKYSRSVLFISISTLFVLLGGCLTMIWQFDRAKSSQAASSSIVGPPSLPAATVNTILSRVGSPMAGEGQVIEEAARRTNIDDAFALGVWWTETNDGEAGVGLADRNPGSVRGSPGYPAAFDGYTIYPSYAAAINDWFNILRSRYVDEGFTSVYAICHPYVGTASAPLWAAKVINLMVRYQGEAPPPTPTVVPTPTRPPLPPRNPKPTWYGDTVTPVATSVQTGPQSIAVPASQPAHITTVPAPTTVPIHSTAPVAVVLKPQSQVETLPVSKTLPVGAALLSALLIGLWGLKIRRSGLPQAQVVTAAWRADEAVPSVYPPLYVNEFSPVLEQQPSPILCEIAERQTAPISYEEIAERQTDEFAFPAVEQMSFPGLSPWIPATAQAPEPAVSGGGLLSRYRSAQASIHNVDWPPLQASSQDYTAERRPSTEVLSWRGGRAMSLPGRHLEPVAVRSAGNKGGGLLSRYAHERQQGDQQF